MSYWKPTRVSDREKIKEIQLEEGILVDGIFGSQTLDLLYRKNLGDKIKTPYYERFYGVDILFGKSIDILDNDGGVLRGKDHAYSLGALFRYPMETISICVFNGVPIDEQSKTSCHYHIDKPESVIYTIDGKTWNMKRVKTVSELPKNTLHAIGGLGLTNYNPVAEGFSKGSYNGFNYDYTDVLRYTNHAVFGITEQGNIVGMMMYSKNVGQVLEYLKSKFRLKHANMLDGGHVPCFNAPGRIFNGSLNQANLIKFK